VSILLCQTNQGSEDCLR